MSKRFSSILLYGLSTLTILVLGFFLSGVLIKEGPKPVKTSKEKFIPTVGVCEVQAAEPVSTIEVQGFVETPRQTTIAAEVKGKIEWVSSKWISGGHVKEGEALMRIEQIDYQTKVSLAEANLAKARLNLETEIAQGEQALKEWENWRAKDPNKPKPSNLVLHIPQKIAAEAEVKAAQDSIEEAKRELERCTVKAPYDAIISKVLVHLGAYVNVGEKVVTLFSDSERDLRFSLTLKESARIKTNHGSPIPIKAYTPWGQGTLEWDGLINRWESTVNRETLSPYYIASLNRNPKHPLAFQVPPIGLFLQIQMEGELPEKCVRIPSRALRQDKEVWLVTKDNQLKQISVQVITRNQTDSIVTGDLQPGEKICTTPPESPVNGMIVTPVTQN